VVGVGGVGGEHLDLPDEQLLLVSACSWSHGLSRSSGQGVELGVLPG
jgi:hypothetical protein